ESDGNVENWVRKNMSGGSRLRWDSGERKNMFIELNISIDERFGAVQIKKFVALLYHGIFNENTRCGTSIKFLYGMSHSSITKTPNNSKIVKGWWLVIEQLKG
ncbi:Hypothetical predicted protein, partial [Prunus dulcis]